MSTLDKIIVLVGFIATLVLFALMFRWELQPDAKDSRIWKLDRLTGKMLICVDATLFAECSEVLNARQ